MDEEPDTEPGLDTAESCWLCDREQGDLCHVHDPKERARRRRLREDDVVSGAVEQGEGIGGSPGDHPKG